MHQTMFDAFREILLAKRVRGRILEIGAMPRDNTLLMMDILQSAERIGVNMAGACEFKGIRIVGANANDLSIFGDGSFDCVLSNATFEHDLYFWKTCGEIRRVLKSGGLAVLATPGFSREGDARSLGIGNHQAAVPEWEESTLVYHYHAAPKDYYRFSPDAYRELMFAGYRDVVVRSVMVPPRLIGHGTRL